MQSDASPASANASGEQGNNGDDSGGRQHWTYQLAWRPRGGASEPRRPRSSSASYGELEQDATPDRAPSLVDDASSQRAFDPSHRAMAGAAKRSRQTSEMTDDNDKVITSTLDDTGAVAAIVYYSENPDPEANDIWPQCRSSAKLPSRYYRLDHNKLTSSLDQKRHPYKGSEEEELVPEQSNEEEGIAPQQSNEEEELAPQQNNEASHLSASTANHRANWNLPVELVELIASYLNRDDIKALRLVSRELNRNVSQVMFQTVVVPFNTEIYGMLGKEAKPDLKGKKRARFETASYSWKNANGDDVYNGHGLDVFRGFGTHILRYGMSFEVTEDTLSMPPNKILTENKTSFWGTYEWPYDEYRRFDAVAGLETAADETPRMTTAFSELTKVKELALSIDNGLGWLNGPDKSIRSRILRKPSMVFGTNKAVPDRKAQAQQELWEYIQSCYQKAGSDIKHATLYRINGHHRLSDLEGSQMLADVQPKLPYLDPQLIHQATPHDMTDIPVPTSFDDPYVLDRFVSASYSAGGGVLFASTISPPDAGQVVNPIIPANLTQAQQEWLLETEWAQRAFMSSYMLSVIDNPATFQLVHSLNISGLSDRYLPMLNRSDFWDALPSLCDITLMVIPGWRTVQKDEAGFVATTPVNPVLGIHAFFSLLQDHIACRPTVRRLTIGWTAGGEHAEGLYARNKLLCPAPVVDLRGRPACINATALMEVDPARLRTLLLELPHIEKLRLKNCWITPDSLVQFVKIHDSHRLKKLVLDSVSLTAILRANIHHLTANPAVQQAAAPQNPPVQAGTLGGPFAQSMQGQQHIIQTYIQTLQFQLQQIHANAAASHQFNTLNQVFALQNRLHHQLQQMQNFYLQHHPQAQGQGQNQTPAPGPLQMPVQAQQNLPNLPQNIIVAIAHVATHVNQLYNQMITTQHNVVGQQPVHHPMPVDDQDTATYTQSALKMKPREGSWVDIIDRISPGTNLSDFGSAYSRADNERTTSLRKINFISCGYAKLPHATFDQTAMDFGHGSTAQPRHPWFIRRMTALSPAMMSAKWPYLANIIQDIHPSEFAVLANGWNLRSGWEDREEARAVEFDGLLPGGTGRFTGTIRQSDRMVDEESQIQRTLPLDVGRLAL